MIANVFKIPNYALLREWVWQISALHNDLKQCYNDWTQYKDQHLKIERQFLTTSGGPFSV